MLRRSTVLAATAAVLAATSAHAQTASPERVSDLAALAPTAPVRWSLDSTAVAAPGAGAEFRLGQVSKGEDRLRLGAVDVSRDAARAPEGRWSLFAAVGGREVTPAATGAAWLDDRAAGYMTSARAGLTMRRGGAQASFGYVRRKIRVSGAQSDLLADMPKTDHLAGFAFSYTLR